MAEFNSYELSRNWFDWCFENPEKITPNHSAIYFFAIEHCNRLGWKTKFGFPTQMVMDAIGIKKHQTYIKYFNDLVEWGFLNLVQKSANQYSANIISLISAKPKSGKALDKAMINHVAKQTQSNGQSNSSIDKPNNIITNKHNNISFNEFWDLYNKKVGDKNKCEKKWNSLKDSERQKIIDTLPAFLNSIPDKQYQPHPQTYLNNSRWNDEISLDTSNNKKHYYLSSPFGTWDGLLTEDEFKAKTLTNYWTLVKIA